MARARRLALYLPFCLLLAACSAQERPEDGPPDGAATVAAQGAADGPYGIDTAAKQPALFAEGIICTQDYEFNTAIAPDGKTLFFAKSDPAFREYTILLSTWRNGRWSAPEVAPFSGRFSDADPAFTRNGKRLYFTSNRPREDDSSREDYDIWYVERQDSGWTDAINAGGDINTPNNEYYPMPVADGSLYLTSDRSGGHGFDIYRSQFVNGLHLMPLRLSEAINSSWHEMDACVDPRELYIVFTAYGRPDSKGPAGFHNGDLFISVKERGVWTPAQSLGELINTPGREFCPALSPDGRYFFFSSDRPAPEHAPVGDYQGLLQRIRGTRNGLGNIFVIDTESILSIPQRNSVQ